MSTHYLVSAFDNKIRSVVSPDSLGKSTITGNYVVKVPDDSVVRNPTDLSNLLTQKYQSMLASHGLFSSIVYDDCLSESDVNVANCDGVQLGASGSFQIYPDGMLETNLSSFVWAGGGAGPAQVLMLWDLFTYEDSYVQNNRYERKYVELPSSMSDFEVQVSFNNGATWTYATHANLTNIALADRGSDLIVRCYNIAAMTSPRIGLGSWAILF